MERKVILINALGLHARASAKLVAHASRFGAHIEISHQQQKVNAKSIMGVMMLGAHQGTLLTLHAEGEDAAEALDDLERLIQDRFGEEA